jgi:hypothetical protein
MKAGGILPFFAGIVVSDRYQGYFSETWAGFAGHQACAAHLIRDFADCAETYPGSGWPEQAQRALRGLIHAWHAAREQALPAIPGDIRQPLELEFRRAVTVGLPAVPWFFREICAIFSSTTDAALRRKREVSLSQAGKAWTRCAEKGEPRKGDSRAPRAKSAPNPANNSMPWSDNQGVPEQTGDESGYRSARGKNPAEKNPGAAKSRVRK